MIANRFYLACLRDTVGSNVSFHCKDSNGYSTNIDKAQVYSRSEAQRRWEQGRDFDLPLSADAVDALTEWHVDCQKLPTESHITEGCEQYVGYKKGRWNGNDVHWLATNYLYSCDFERAQKFSAPNFAAEIVWVPFAMADAAKRRTFCIDLIDKRRMIRSAGLVTPEHVKKHRRRKNNGMTRFNCPACGRFAWQHNPYDFMGCRDASCDGGAP